MEFGGNLFGAEAIWAVGVVDALILVMAFRHAPWRRLLEMGRSHAYFAALVVVMLLWSLRADVVQGLQFHLLGVTSLTLMFGWSLALIGATVALVGVILAGWSDWSGFSFSFITLALAPISLTYISLILVRSYLPKHFVIYVFINAFVTGGLVGMSCGYLSAAILVMSGAYSFSELQDTVMPFFPIMFSPEGVFNGWIMTLMVVLKPEWVYSFSDEEYLDGK